MENIFWSLDPNAKGQVKAKDLHALISPFKPTNRSRARRPPPLILDDQKYASRAQQRIIESMIDDIPKIIKACKKLDPLGIGTVSKDDFLWALREAGVILSCSDANQAVKELSNRSDGVVTYEKLYETTEEKSSELLSPKNKSKHLSTASAIIQHTDEEKPPEPSHPKPKSDIEYCLQDPDTDRPGTLKELLTHSLARGKLEACLKILKERRHVVKSCFVNYSTRAAGKLSRKELADCLQSSRLRLSLSREEATSIVNEIVPNDVTELTFPDFVRYLGLQDGIDLKSELTLAEPAGETFKVVRYDRAFMY